MFGGPFLVIHDGGPCDGGPFFIEMFVNYGGPFLNIYYDNGYPLWWTILVNHVCGPFWLTMLVAHSG